MKRPLEPISQRQVGKISDVEDEYAARCEAMVERQIARRGIKDLRVLAAMRCVPRHLFVPEEDRSSAYEDHPLPIGHAQTISQPYIVAYMTEALRLPECARVLEVGTGSAYQTAVLAEITQRVFSLEIIPELAARAAALLARLGYENVETAESDGCDGWPEQAPFDGILVTAAAEEVPPTLLKQLKPGARLIVPLGARIEQRLVLVTREGDGYRQESLLPVCFVPLTGRAKTE